MVYKCMVVLHLYVPLKPPAVTERFPKTLIACIMN